MVLKYPKATRSEMNAFMSECATEAAQKRQRGEITTESQYQAAIKSCILRKIREKWGGR